VVGIALGPGRAFGVSPAASLLGAQPGHSDPQPVHVSVVSGMSNLYPGFTGDITLKLVNSNPFPVTLDSMTASVTSASPANCPGSNISVAPATGLALSIPASATRTALIPGVLSMAPTAPDGCRGVAFNVAFSLSEI
jgi:hypothetical protein